MPPFVAVPAVQWRHLRDGMASVAPRPTTTDDGARPVCVACTCYHPPHACVSPLPQATFLACMIPSEFSWHMLAVVATAAWAYFRNQRRLTLPVVVCGGLNTVTAGILAWMGLQSSRAHTVFKAAFRRVGMLTTPATSRPTTWTRAALSVLPLPQMLTRDIEIERSIVYGRVGRKRLKLDLYWHKENLRRPNAPVFMYIHGVFRVCVWPAALQVCLTHVPVCCVRVVEPSGGGWITGHRFFHSLPLLLHMARNGWLVATINYRLAPRVTMPEQLVDCKRAVAWMKRNAAKFGGNPDFLLVGGESAGGHLSAMVGLTAGDRSIQVGFESEDTSVQGTSLTCMWRLAGTPLTRGYCGFCARRRGGGLVRCA